MYCDIQRFLIIVLCMCCNTVLLCSVIQQWGKFLESGLGEFFLTLRPWGGLARGANSQRLVTLRDTASCHTADI